MVNKTSIRAGVIGARGYTGREVVRLVLGHPRLELLFATSRSRTGARVVGTEQRYVSASDAPLGDADVVFVCLPGGSSGPWAVRARSAGARVVDLSSDLRDGTEDAVYGLPELARGAIADAELVANPGCYPTGALLALAPAVEAGVVDLSRPVVIDAASGVTGAGRTPRMELLFGEVAGDYRAYGVGNRHRHVEEIAAGLERMDPEAPSFVFTPHLLPVRRGILETMYVPLTAPLSARDADDLWSEMYAREPFVEVWGVAASKRGLPSLRGVTGRNVVALGFSDVERVPAPTLLVVAALDNLLKGAAGQAMQNVNLMLGLDERQGLAW